MQMLAHLPQERSAHRVMPSNQNKLTRNFIKPVSFKTNFYARRAAPREASRLWQCHRKNKMRHGKSHSQILS
jgi:hypothetical protein